MKIFCSKHNTKFLICIIWIVVIIRGCIAYLYFDCDFYYDSNILAFVFSKTKDCQFISFYVDFAKDSFIVITVGIVDAITITVVQITNRRMRKARHDMEMDKRRKREIKFLKQVVLQGVLFSVELFTYFHLAWKYQNHWAVFAMTTLAWNLVHCGDALINVGFNAEFRKLLTSPKQIFRKKHVISNYSGTGGQVTASRHN
ncbi:unnamed protein product [Cylicocyclus nassatus]|uniref:7TM GPCR serpentine receptor class x (Srx) domain-containing protein n=1 Tax=Cylicocyclus nassatus TaxID=53992 RepID=A0AA36DKK4_CYLNA|nr:unnamed protein product [Cylicocyclus nassatus]